MLAGIALALANVCPARAQGDAAGGALSEKNDHVFVPTSFIPDAFINTTLGLTMGYSSAIRTDIPLFAPDGRQIGTVEGDLLFMNGGAEFTCALRDWIGFFARFSALARAGSNTASIFASGLSAGSAFCLGWEFRLAETDKSILSGSVDVGSTSLTIIDIRSFIESPELGLSRSYTPLITNVNIRYAYGVNDLVGLSAYASAGLGETPGDNLENSGFWRLGGVASFSLARRHDIPLGFALGLRTSSYPVTFEHTDGNSWTALASIAYMGRPDFALTLDTEYESVPIAYEDVTMNYVGVTIALRYYF